MIDWVIVLAALCGGIALLASRFARQETLPHPTTRLFVWVVPAVVMSVAALTAGLSAWDGLRGGAAQPALRAVTLPDGGAAPAARGALPTLTPLAAARWPSPALAAAEPNWEPVTPARLQIPALNVDAVIQPIYLRAGVWDVDPLTEGVGWLESTGARPGADYAMTLIGHITLANARRGPFADLQHIPLGAEVVYLTATEAYVYAVRAKGRLTTEDVGQLYLPDGQSLLLLTCTDWDPATRTYAKRLLVRAELIEARPLASGDAPDRP